MYTTRTRFGHGERSLRNLLARWQIQRGNEIFNIK